MRAIRDCGQLAPDHALDGGAAHGVVEKKDLRQDSALRGLMQRVGSLLRSQVQCVLATASPQGQPSTHLMAYAYSPDLTSVVIASGVRSRKVDDMLSNPSVSLLWDNRTGNLQDHGDGMLVTASGQASQLSADAAAAATAQLLERNPNLASFVARDDVAVLRVAVDTYAVVVGYGAPELVDPRTIVLSVSE